MSEQTPSVVEPDEPELMYRKVTKPRGYPKPQAPQVEDAPDVVEAPKLEFGPRESMVGVMYENNGDRDYFKGLNVEVENGLLSWQMPTNPKVRKYIALAKLSSLEIEDL